MLRSLAERQQTAPCRWARGSLTACRQAWGSRSACTRRPEQERQCLRGESLPFLEVLLFGGENCSSTGLVLAESALSLRSVNGSLPPKRKVSAPDSSIPALRPPELKISTPAHTKHLGRCVEFEFRVTHHCPNLKDGWTFLTACSSSCTLRPPSPGSAPGPAQNIRTEQPGVAAPGVGNRSLVLRHLHPVRHLLPVLGQQSEHRLAGQHACGQQGRRRR